MKKIITFSLLIIALSCVCLNIQAASADIIKISKHDGYDLLQSFFLAMNESYTFGEFEQIAENAGLYVYSYGDAVDDGTIYFQVSSVDAGSYQWGMDANSYKAPFVKAEYSIDHNNPTEGLHLRSLRYYAIPKWNNAEYYIPGSLTGDHYFANEGDSGGRYPANSCSSLQEALNTVLYLVGSSNNKPIQSEPTYNSSPVVDNASSNAPSEPSMTYVVNPSTMIFHTTHSCPRISLNSSNCQSINSTRAELIASGYQPCSSCGF